MHNGHPCWGDHQHNSDTTLGHVGWQRVLRVSITNCTITTVDRRDNPRLSAFRRPNKSPIHYTLPRVQGQISFPQTEYLLFNISDPVQLTARTSNRSATSAIWDPSWQTAHGTSEGGSGWHGLFSESLKTCGGGSLSRWRPSRNSSRQPVCQSCYTAVSPGS